MYNKYKSLLLTQILAWVLLAVIAVCIFILPYLVGKYVVNDNNTLKSALYICLYTSVIPAVIGDLLLLKILGNIRKNEVFADSNVSCLRYISWCCFAAAGCYCVLGIFITFSLVVACAIAFAGLVIRVIKNLMREAVDIKRENDLTV